jgi:hypothetical protein
MTAQIGTAILLEYRNPRPQQVGDAIELDYSGGATAIGQGGMRLGGSAAIQTLIRALFEYPASGGLRAGGVAETVKLTVVVHTYQGAGGAALSGIAPAALVFRPISASDGWLARIRIDGTAWPASQITLNRGLDDSRATLQIPGRVPAPIGAPVEIAIVRDGIEVGAFVGTIAESPQDGDLTTIIATGPAVLSNATWQHKTALYRANGRLRTEVDWAVRPGQTIDGRKIQSVSTTLGVSSIWFTEADFG